MGPTFRTSEEFHKIFISHGVCLTQILGPLHTSKVTCWKSNGDLFLPRPCGGHLSGSTELRASLSCPLFWTCVLCRSLRISQSLSLSHSLSLSLVPSSSSPVESSQGLNLNSESESEYIYKCLTKTLVREFNQNRNKGPMVILLHSQKHCL